VQKRRLLAGAAAVSIGIAGALAAITPALAGPVTVKGITTHIVTATATAPAGNTGEAKATCGSGQLRVGGGYTVNSTSTDWQIFVDAPLNGKSWLVEPVNFSAQPLSFSAYAICAKSAPGKNGLSGYTTHVVDASVDAPPMMTAEADATCPAGDLLTGGGYEVENVSSNWSAYLNAPSASNVWTVEIDNEVPVTTTYDSLAVCLAKKNGNPVTALMVSTVDTAATVPANSVQTADVSCGANELMTGGGHVINSIGQDWIIPASGPVTTNDWQVKVADLDTFSRDFFSIAVCLAAA
jgi:hypothetical protein